MSNPGNDTIASFFDDDEWRKVLMPVAAAVGEDKQNIKFIKKLVAVAVSNILYLRAEFPEDAFVMKKLGSMELRTLQKIKGKADENLPSNILIELVKECMSAIDKGYLRKMTLVIFEGDQDAEEGDMRKAYETYSFYFGQQDKDFSLSRSSRGHGGGDVPIGETGDVPTELTEEKIIRATKRLLRRLISATQELDVLPEVANLTICLEYYDKVTPKDYQPKLYGPSDTTPQVSTSDENGNQENGNGNISQMGMGQIDLMHKKMAVRLRSKAAFLSEDDELHPASLEKQQAENVISNNVEEVERVRDAVNSIRLEGEDRNNVSERDDDSMDIETAHLSTKDRKRMTMKMKRKQLEKELDEDEMEMNKKFKKWSTYKDNVNI